MNVSELKVLKPYVSFKLYIFKCHVNGFNVFSEWLL